MTTSMQTEDDKFALARQKIYNSLMMPSLHFNKHDALLSDNSLGEINVQLKLSEILLEHNPTFIEEKNRLPLKFSTGVEFKEGSLYRSYKLEISENSLLIVKYIKRRVNESNKDSVISDKSNQSEKTPIKEPRYSLIEDYYEPVLSLNFNMITAGLTVIKEQMELALHVLGSDLVFRMRVNNKEIFDKMVIAIKLAICTSKGARINLIGVSKRLNWQVNYFITNEQFMKKAKTGDMLIFRGNECPSTCQRALTWNEYDHVVFLQRKNDYLFLFEATSREGCKIQSWRDYIGLLWNLIYEKIVYRELIISSPQKDKMQAELEVKTEAFIQSTKSKKYDISICSIMCGAKTLDHERRNQWGQSEGFSCSSLLAAAYVSLGIIPYKKGTSSFLPGQFSQKANISMNEPFSLGPEVIIDFSS